MRRILTRLVSFSALPFVSVVIPLLALPIIARVGGVPGWAALAIGQALGGFAAATAFAGWNVLGTPLVATAKDAAAQARLYDLSFSSRLVALAVAGPLAAIVAAVLSPESARLIAVLAALSSAVAALGISWFAVGVGSARLIALYDLLPRLIATVLSIPVVLLTQRVEPYLIGLLLAPLAGLCAFHLRTRRRAFPAWAGMPAVTASYRAHRAAWWVEITGNASASAPVPVASVVGGASTAASFGSGDRLYRYGLYAVVSFGNALQGWVLEPGGVDPRAERARRNSFAIALMAALGVAGGLGLALLGAPVSALLFGESVAAVQTTMVWFGVAYVAVSTSTPLIRNVLVPARRERAVLVVTVVSAVIGIVTMVTFGALWGAAGVAMGLAASELCTVIVCAVLTMRVGLHPVTSREDGRVDE